MILRSLRVEGWRCFADPIEIGPLADGLNIVCGPNGSGKSSLMLALARGLFDGHRVSADAIQSLRPWGRDLAPRVTLEFEHGGERYRLKKQFLDAPSSELERWEEGRFVRLASERKADDRVRELLAADLPSRGATKPEHWGLAQILWAEQGQMALPSLGDNARATLQGSLGAQVVGAGGEALEQKIADLYGQFFTGSGRVKGGASAPPIVALEDQRTKALARRAELSGLLEQFEEAGRTIDDLKRRAEQAERDEQAISHQLRQARIDEAAYRELVGERKLCESKLQQAQDAYRTAQQRRDLITSLRSEVDAQQRKLQQLRDDLPAQEKLVEQRRAELERAELRKAEVRTRRTQVRDARQLAEDAQRYVDSLQRLQDSRRKLERVEEIQRELDRLRTERLQHVAPDKKTLKRIKDATHERDRVRMQLDAALITVQITPEVDIAIDVTVAEQLGSLSASAGQLQTIRGESEVAFRIPGVGTIRAIGPASSVEELRSGWNDACELVRELTLPFGSDDLEQLERLREIADQLDAKVRQEEAQSKLLLGDSSLDKLCGEIASAAAIVDGLLGQHEEWREQAPQPESLKNVAEEVEQRFTDEIDRAERDADEAREKLDGELERQRSREGGLRQAQIQLEEQEKRLAAELSDRLSDEERTKRLQKLALQCDIESGKLEQVKAKQSAFGQDPARTVTVLEGQLEGARSSARGASGQLIGQRMRLDKLIADAPYSKLAAVEEEIERLGQEITRQRRRMDAVRLLFETMTSFRDRVLRRVTDPVRRRAIQTLQRIAGGRFEEVGFDDSLVATHVVPRRATDNVALEQLSGGEQEQLHFAVRLALAEVAFGTERQLLVLDDVFTYTDTARLARIVAILEETAQRFQILLLTCHPERYRGLPQARVIDLEELRHASTSDARERS